MVRLLLIVALLGIQIGDAIHPGPPCLDGPEVQSEEEVHEEDLYTDMATDIDWATWFDSERLFKLSAVPQSTAERVGRGRGRGAGRDDAL